MRSCPTCGARYTDDLVYCPNDGTATTVAPAGGPSADDLVGAIIDGRYRIERRIGEGGMGVVYRASHVVLKKPLAIKVMRREQAQDGEVVQRFVQEAQASSAIGHANIIGINDFGRTPDGSVYFTMELLEGQTLGKAMENDGPLPVDRALGVFLQITGALEAAHQRGIVHRDLKPDNLFLVQRSGERDFVKVLDFGIAKVKNAAAKITRTGMVFGTPHYMSPEQAAGQAVDHRSDIYSLGVIMFQVFAGQLPFEAASYMGVMTKHMFDDPPKPSALLSSLRGPIEDMILMALAKRPEQRYQSMQDVHDDSERIWRGEPAKASARAALLGGDTQSFASPPVPAASASLQDSSVNDGTDEVSLERAIRRRSSWLWPAVGVGAAGVLALWVLLARDPAPPLAAGPRSSAPGVAPATSAASPAVAAGGSVALAQRTVRIMTTPADAEVEVDGARLGRGDVSVALARKGRAAVVVRSAGHLSEELALDERSPEAIRVVLQALPPSATQGAAPQPSRTRQGPPRRSSEVATESPPPPSAPAPARKSTRAGALNDVVDPWQ